MTVRVLRFLAFAVLAFAFSGCSEMMSGPDGGPRDGGRLEFDAGPPPIVYTQFIKRSNGWPANARVVGAATVSGVLYAASTDGVVKLPAPDTTWTTELTPLSGDVKPTSFQRDDQRLVMTAAGATMGGLFIKELDGAWAQVTTAPSNPTWALVKKGNEWLMATTGGLYVATDLAGPWSRRTALGNPLFAQKITRLVAGAGQQKIFTWGLAGSGVLYESADLGVTWMTATPRGAVEALAASGAIVVISTAIDGQQRSDNYGNTFRTATMPIADGVLFYATDGTASFWAAGNGGLKKSADYGVSFTDDPDGLPSGTPIL
ncbi:MAG: hypothetical protein JNM17_05045, partial [Archangium sp.]|nr:hypothetical protein [Archangium sp.]